MNHQEHPRGESRLRAWIPAVLILLAMALLLTAGLPHHSPVVDEPFHLTRGLAWWWTDSTRLSYAHPPFGNLAMTWIAGVGPPTIDLSTLPGWDRADHMAVAEAFLQADYEGFRTLLIQARLASAVLGLALAAYVFSWTRRYFGDRAALIALAMTAFNPSLLAHAQLVTTDLPVALTTTLVVGTFIDYLLTPSGDDPDATWPTAAFGVAMGLALATKFTSLTLVPWFALVGAWFAWGGHGRFASAERAKNAIDLLGDMLVVALLGMIVVVLAYRGQDTGMTVGEILSHPEPQCYLTERLHDAFLEKRGLLQALPAWLPLPVPYTWLFGLEMVRHQSFSGHQNWFMGSVGEKGHLLYFPVLLLLKTPLPVWAGLVAGAISWRPGARPTAPTLLLVATSAWFVAWLLSANLNIGFRHALPVVPLLTILAAAGTQHALQTRPAKVRRGVLAAGLLALVAVAVQSRDAYLSWFNVGPTLGHQVSMVGEDWGQDVHALATLAREEALTPLAYRAYGLASGPELASNGAEFTPATCKSPPAEGWLALHMAQVVREKGCKPFRTHAPERLIEHHIGLWRLPLPEEADEHDDTDTDTDSDLPAQAIEGG